MDKKTILSIIISNDYAEDTGETSMREDFIIQINNVEERLRQAMLASDVAALDALLDSELTFTNHLGHCVSKDADIAAHQSGALRISLLEPSEQQLKIISDKVAVVSVRVRLDGEYDGQPAGGDFRFTRVWTQSADGNWQVAAAHASSCQLMPE